MDKLGLLVWFIAATPFMAIAEAFSLQRIWIWFLRSQYGAGPSLGAWFGISAIVVILTVHLPHRAMSDDPVALWKRTGAQLLWLAVILGITYVTGAVLGWTSR